MHPKILGCDLDGTLVVTEAPDDETIAKRTLSVGSQRSFRAETLRAYTEEDYQKIIAALP